MQFNRTDCVAMQGAVELLNYALTQDPSATGYITDANDESHQNITIDVMKMVLLEMLNAYGHCHSLKQTFRSKINECSTKEELDAIVFDWDLD